MSGWYQKIAKDISAIPDAIKHYEDELEQARYEIKIKGNVEKASAKYARYSRTKIQPTARN